MAARTVQQLVRIDRYGGQPVLLYTPAPKWLPPMANIWTQYYDVAQILRRDSALQFDISVASD
jgi:hypothetical protein